MLHVLPPMFKPVNNLICCKTGLMWVVKCATSLFISFCSNVAKQFARFLLPVFRTVSLHADEGCKGVHIVIQMMTVVLRK